MTPRLSVCIPTYNFGAFIGETLGSILSQVTPNVEVVVLDSGSTDDTADIVIALQSQYPSLRYVRNAQRGGIDRDMAAVVDLAKGEYCWLFSADDIMAADGIARVLFAIESGADIYIASHQDSDLRLHVVREHHPVFRLSADRTFDCADPQQCRAYFELAESTEAFFSFMCGLIVRRAAWNALALDERFIGTCWAHAARLLTLVQKGCRVQYLHRPLLNRRGENDSFSSRGVVERYALAIEGYHRIAAELFGAASFEAFHIRRVLRNEFTLGYFLYAKSLTRTHPDRESAARLRQLAEMHFADASLRNTLGRVIFGAVPVPAYRALRSLYHGAKRLVGSRA